MRTLTCTLVSRVNLLGRPTSLSPDTLDFRETPRGDAPNRYPPSMDLD